MFAILALLHFIEIHNWLCGFGILYPQKKTSWYCFFGLLVALVALHFKEVLILKN
jgi:hypothetical protein